eukprot:6400169-Amphidinium_carterae.1
MVLALLQSVAPPFMANSTLTAWKLVTATAQVKIQAMFGGFCGCQTSHAAAATFWLSETCCRALAEVVSQNVRQSSKGITNN